MRVRRPPATDLLSTYVFGLHPMPFCGEDGVACHDAAPSKLQFAYAFFILLVGAVLRFLAGRERFKHLPGARGATGRLQHALQHVSHSNSMSLHDCYMAVTRRLHEFTQPFYMAIIRPLHALKTGVDTVPAMVGMCVGWAYGDACLQLLSEIKATRPELCAPPLYDTLGSPADCSGIDLLFSCGLLALSTVFIVLVQPLTKARRRHHRKYCNCCHCCHCCHRCHRCHHCHHCSRQNIEFGDGAWIDALEDSLEIGWQLLSKASATSGGRHVTIYHVVLPRHHIPRDPATRPACNSHAAPFSRVQS